MPPLSELCFGSKHELVTDVCRRLRTTRATGFVAVDKVGRPRGIMTERDIVNKVVGRTDLSTLQVLEVMTPNPLTGQDGITDAAIIKVLAENGFRHLPIVDTAGKLIRTHDTLALGSKLVRRLTRRGKVRKYCLR